jgi:hypothetical protein
VNRHAKYKYIYIYIYIYINKLIPPSPPITTDPAEQFRARVGCHSNISWGLNLGDLAASTQRCVLALTTVEMFPGRGPDCEQFMPLTQQAWVEVRDKSIKELEASGLGPRQSHHLNEKLVVAAGRRYLESFPH